MYSTIVNPRTGRRVSITGRLGRQILRKYLTILSGGMVRTESNLSAAAPPLSSAAAPWFPGNKAWPGIPTVMKAPPLSSAAAPWFPGNKAWPGIPTVMKDAGDDGPPTWPGIPPALKNAGPTIGAHSAPHTGHQVSGDGEGAVGSATYS